MKYTPQLNASSRALHPAMPQHARLDFAIYSREQFESVRDWCDANITAQFVREVIEFDGQEQTKYDVSICAPDDDLILARLKFA